MILDMGLVNKNCAEVWMVAIKENNDDNGLHPLASKFLDIVKTEGTVANSMFASILLLWIVFTF